MPDKSVPLSARISVDDAEFLARLRIEGATTPSEKIRGLLADARRRADASSSYGSALTLVQDSLAPATRALRESEHAEGMHSEFALTVAEWLPDAIAFYVSSIPTLGDEDRRAALEELEKGLADRVFRLLEQTLRLGITPELPGYSSSLVSDRLDRVLSLLDVIRSRQLKADPTSEESRASAPVDA